VLQSPESRRREAFSRGTICHHQHRKAPCIEQQSHRPVVRLICKVKSDRTAIIFRMRSRLSRSIHKKFFYGGNFFLSAVGAEPLRVARAVPLGASGGAGISSLPDGRPTAGNIPGDGHRGWCHG
jgi:hypothetical protein